MQQSRKYAAEFIGTFYLCFAGISAILCNGHPIGSQVGLLGIALAHGLALSIAVSIFGGISGGHINPAVTAAMFSTGRIGAGTAVGYVISQCAGATTAAALCEVVFPTDIVRAANLGIPLPGLEWVTPGVIVLYEAVMTFLLVTAVFGAAVDERGRVVKIGAFAIGLTVTFDILAGGAITGASMNPARSFGPALAAGHFHLHWCYWVGPLIGGVSAGLLYHHFFLKED
jgi:MIP family channel proteins